jgi:hypothetical protein
MFIRRRYLGSDDGFQGQVSHGVPSPVLFSVASRFVRRSGSRVSKKVNRYWRKMLSSRSWQGQICWNHFQQIKERFPLLRPKLYLPYSELQAMGAGDRPAIRWATNDGCPYRDPQQFGSTAYSLPRCRRSGVVRSRRPVRAISCRYNPASGRHLPPGFSRTNSSLKTQGASECAE